MAGCNRSRGLVHLNPGMSVFKATHTSPVRLKLFAQVGHDISNTFGRQRTLSRYIRFDIQDLAVSYLPFPPPTLMLRPKTSNESPPKRNASGLSPTPDVPDNHKMKTAQTTTVTSDNAITGHSDGLGLKEAWTAAHQDRNRPQARGAERLLNKIGG